MPRRRYRRIGQNRASQAAVYVQIARDVIVGLAALGAYIAYVQKNFVWQVIGLAAVVGVIGFAAVTIFAINRIRQRLRANRSN